MSVMDWNPILNWRLLAFSHDFPGPDGGTCIAEVAIVAAGFEYRSVSSAIDLPPCFSLPIGQFFIGINDLMPDDLRQELLMPYVERLAGTADTWDVEIQRVRYLMAAAEKWAAVTTAVSAWATKEEVAASLAHAAARAAALGAAVAAERAGEEAYGAFWKTEVIPVCDGLLAIGNQAEPVEHALIVQRTEAIKGLALQAEER